MTDQTHTAPIIVGVRFSKVGKIYHFDARKIEALRLGDVVVVETSRGWQLGEVVVVVDDPVAPPEGTWKALDRLATPKDLMQRQNWQSKELDVVEIARKRLKELRLQGVKIIFSEYSYDGSKLTIFFSSDSEDKVDLKSMRSDMQRVYGPAQVELRQIGPRDVAKVLGGMGACGLETRCCSKFITEFSSISIRMAKEQGISLTPTEITGMCGRLRCCLIYEYDNYVEARKLLPKKNKRVITPDGTGKVIDVSPIREMVLVELPEIGRKEYHKDVLKPADEMEALEAKAQAGCGGGNGGGGGCGGQC
ncbi:MAG: stage 0 sporulation protein [Anaerolineae bacterium]|nr:stage 0 sporulation protein [Anaerolineae bacterium]